MEAKPLKREIMEQALEMGVKKIWLSFSGGYDEGHLDITFKGGKTPKKFYNDVENWVWSVYEYSGAGCGSEYGDEVIYDLEHKKILTQEWYMERHEEPEQTGDLKTTDE